MDPTTPLFFREEGKIGGPTAVVYHFDKAFSLLYGEGKGTKYHDYKEHPMYKSLNKLHLNNIKEINYDKEHPNGFNLEGNEAKSEAEKAATIAFQKQQQQHQPLLQPEPQDEMCSKVITIDDDELLQRRQKTCDDIFAEYLNFVARKTRKEYYAKALSFAFLFRECVNEAGERLNEEKKLLPQELFPINGGVGKNEDYCLTNNAEQVPDVSNEFITNFLSEKKLDALFPSTEAIDLTQNLCHWLFINGYTCSKLSLIQ